MSHAHSMHRSALPLVGLHAKKGKQLDGRLAERERTLPFHERQRSCVRQNECIVVRRVPFARIRLHASTISATPTMPPSSIVEGGQMPKRSASSWFEMLSARRDA